MKTTIGKTYFFSAGHHLPNLPEDHSCRRPHGHNYVVEIALEGKPDPVTGMVFDFGMPSRYADVFVGELDHRDLNDIIDNPTAENIAAWFCESLQTTILRNYPLTITVWETPRCWAKVTHTPNHSQET